MKTIGKYQVQKVLGHGGMGTVYEALDPLLQRKVAIKTMVPGLVESPDLRIRFLREAQAAGGLRHRNIVTVYDVGEDQGQPYISMEYIDGTDLEKVIQGQEPRLLEWKLEVLRQICDGLGHAHENGIVHRDVKPANIRVTPEGEVKIMDFGIAHLQSSTMTKGGLVFGTVHYMAPEQIEGHKVDHRADIFSVGAIAYELLTYRKPFEADSVTSVMFKIMHERPDPGAIPDEPFPGLADVVMKALARDYIARYQSLREMRADLEELVRSQVSRGRMESSTPTPGPEQRRNELKAEMERARGDGQLQKALRIAKRILEIEPADPDAVRATDEIEAAIQDGEVAQLCTLAMSYAADRDSGLALKIAEKVGRLAPESPRYHELRAFLDEDARRRRAQELTAAAQEHLVEGDLEAARTAAESALAADPSHALAREIRDRSAQVLATQAKATAEAHSSGTIAVATPPPLAPEPVAVPSVAVPPVAVPPVAVPPIAVPPVAVPPIAGPPSADPPVAVPPAGPAPEPEAPISDAVAPPRKPQAAGLGAGRRSEAAALTAAALDHFVQNDQAKARKAVEQALALEPGNRKARELAKILGSLP